MATSKPKSDVPNFTPGDYVKFFGAGALAATLTHGVMHPSYHVSVMTSQY